MGQYDPARKHLFNCWVMIRTPHSKCIMTPESRGGL
jgi:hypothetical protein